MKFPLGTSLLLLVTSITRAAGPIPNQGFIGTWLNVTRDGREALKIERDGMVTYRLYNDPDGRHPLGCFTGKLVFNLVPREAKWPMVERIHGCCDRIPVSRQSATAEFIVVRNKTKGI